MKILSKDNIEFSSSTNINSNNFESTIIKNSIQMELNSLNQHQQQSSTLSDTTNEPFSIAQNTNDFQSMTNSSSMQFMPKCPLCDKTFANSSNLKHHMNTIHFNEAKWVCNECGKVCTSKSNLKVHLRVHLRVKPYYCRWCDYNCMHHSSIRDHLSKCHPEKSHNSCEPGYIFNSAAVPEPELSHFDIKNSKNFEFLEFQQNNMKFNLNGKMSPKTINNKSSSTQEPSKETKNGTPNKISDQKLIKLRNNKIQVKKNKLLKKQHQTPTNNKKAEELINNENFNVNVNTDNDENNETFFNGTHISSIQDEEDSFYQNTIEEEEETIEDEAHSDDHEDLNDQLKQKEIVDFENNQIVTSSIIQQQTELFMNNLFQNSTFSPTANCAINLNNIAASLIQRLSAAAFIQQCNNSNNQIFNIKNESNNSHKNKLDSNSNLNSNVLDLSIKSNERKKMKLNNNESCNFYCSDESPVSPVSSISSSSSNTKTSKSSLFSLKSQTLINKKLTSNKAISDVINRLNLNLPNCKEPLVIDCKSKLNKKSKGLDADETEEEEGEESDEDALEESDKNEEKSNRKTSDITNECSSSCLSVSTTNLDQHQSSPGYKCTYCSIIFNEYPLYSIHAGMHSNLNPWKCNVCGHVCTNKIDFAVHILHLSRI